MTSQAWKLKYLISMSFWAEFWVFLDLNESSVWEKKAMSFRSIFHLYLLKRSVEFASRLPCLNKNDCHVGCGWLWRAQDEEVCLRLSRAKIQKSYTFLPTGHKVSLSAALISKLCCSRKCATFSVYFPWKHSIFVKINAEIWSRRI